MKTLLTTDCVGGVWTYSLELAGALEAQGVDVVLASMGRPLSPRQRTESRGRRTYAADWALEWMPHPWTDVSRAAEWLLWIAARERPDVVHLNQFSFGSLPFEAPVLVVGHSCVLSWHEAVRGQPAGPEWSRYRKAVEAGLAGADLVAAPTKTMLRALRRHYAFDTESAVVANGRSSPFVALPKERLVAGVGRFWDEAKNVSALDRAAARLDVPVLLAGEAGDARPRHARLLGPVADVAPLLARAAVFASPARYEPFGLAVLEAALAGCALVLADLPSLREVWDADALFVDPDDDEALATAIALALDDPDLGRRARERACAYTPGRMAASYLDLYERLKLGTFERVA